MMKLIYIIITLFYCTILVSQITQVISWQGILTDSQGIRLNGQFTITVNIYNVESGGTALWTETHSSVLISEGITNLMIGKYIKSIYIMN